MIIPSVNFLKSNFLSNSSFDSSKYQNQLDRPRIPKKYHGISRFWQCSTLLVAGLTCLIMAHSATPAVAQQRIIEQFLDINNRQNVFAIQTALERLGYTISIDGRFGPETRNVLLNFQRDNNLPVTGVVDNNTASKLFARTQGIDFPSPPDGNRERFCRDENNRNQICPYVVLIPGDNNRLSDIRERLWVKYRFLAEDMVLEDHGRGLFIRIDQYPNRDEAERVANMLRSNVSPDFRVEFLPTVTPVSARG